MPLTLWGPDHLQALRANERGANECASPSLLAGDKNILRGGSSLFFPPQRTAAAGYFFSLIICPCLVDNQVGKKGKTVGRHPGNGVDPTFPISLPPIPLAYQDLLLRSFGSFTEEEEEGWERTLPVKAGGGGGRGGGKRARAILFSRARGCDGGAISQKKPFSFSLLWCPLSIAAPRGDSAQKLAPPRL